MADCVEIQKKETCVELCFSMLSDQIVALMEKLLAANPDILMSSYDWEALWTYCLKKKDPDILSGMKMELDMAACVASWPLSPENEARAARFEALICSMVEEEEELCRIVREEGSAIEWELKDVH